MLEYADEVYYNTYMESKLSSKTLRKVKRKAAFLRALRYARTGLLCVLGILAGGFFVMPAALALQGAPQPTGNVVIRAPHAPQNINVLSPAAPTPTPYVPDNTPNQAIPVVRDMQSQAKPQYKQLSFGDEDAAVMDIQAKLMELGYIDSDEPTKKFGPATQSAVTLFQRMHHLAETGVADELLQSVLFSENALPYVLKEGDKGGDVKKLQLRLEELGYFDGTVSGYFGVATAEALAAFQTKNKLDADAEADRDTLDLLHSPKAKPKIDPTPSPTPKPTRTPSPAATPKTTKSPSTSSTPAPSSGPDWGGGSTPVTTTPSSDGSSGSIAVVGSGVGDFIAVAKSRLGCPYVWSDEGPNSFDCSGLVYYSLRSVGVKVGRYSAAGFAEVSSWGTVTSVSQLQPGDLIFFKSDGSNPRITHTGIWLGGNTYIHASSSSSKVVISSWSPWAERNFMLGKRVF